MVYISSSVFSTFRKELSVSSLVMHFNLRSLPASLTLRSRSCAMKDSNCSLSSCHLRLLIGEKSRSLNPLISEQPTASSRFGRSRFASVLAKVRFVDSKKARAKVGSSLCSFSFLTPTKSIYLIKRASPQSLVE